MQLFKRFILTFLISILVLITILIVSYSKRLAIINNIAQSQLADYQTEVTCLDFHFTKNMAVTIDKLCLKSAKANIEIKNTKIQWLLSTAPKVTAIDISLVSIKGMSPIFDNLTSNTSQIQSPSTVNDPKEAQSLSQLISAVLTPYIESVSQLPLTTNINIEQFNYSPYLSKNHVIGNGINNVKNKAITQSEKATSAQFDEITYQGAFKLINNRLNLSLGDVTNKDFLSAQLNIDKENFTIKASSELTPLLYIAQTHQLPMSAELQALLNSSVVSGNISLLIENKADTLIINSKLTDLAVSSTTLATSFNSNINFNSFGTINFQTKIDITAKNSDIVGLTFIDDNNLTVEYDPKELLTLLNERNVSEEIISVIKDNPVSQLSIRAEPNSTLKISDEQVTLSALYINAKGNLREHHVKLNDIALNPPLSYRDNANQLVISNFIIESHLKIAALSKFSKDLVNVHFLGSLTKTNQQTTFNITDGSFVAVKGIKLPIEQNNSDPAALIAIKENKIKLNGSVSIEENNQFSLDLNINSKASQLSIPKKIELNTFDIVGDIKADIKDDLDNININAIISANKVRLSSISVTGSIQSPQIQVSASELQLTDLLSFNMKLPTEVSLIDGVLDYNIEGQLSDLNKPLNNELTATITISSLSGEIDGIWLQELNWHQELTLHEGKLSTQQNNKENLTIGLIDTATPVSMLNTHIGFAYNENFDVFVSSLNANVLGGSFSIPEIKWPLEKGHSVDVQLTSIDLEQVLALDKKQGIVVTGNISGQLPIFFDGKKFTIGNGKLYNINNGLIQVVNNPAVTELKNSNTQLQLAFDALQNLHYHQLSSAVSMADDGYMLLQTEIKGRNPDIDNDVNLNLNLSYDLPGLLESLSITERFEKNIIDGLQKN